MSPAANTLLALILIALGIIGIILSFSVADRKKYLISISLAGAIVVIGVFQWAAQSISRIQLNRRMREIQRERQADLETLRGRLNQTAPSPAAGAKQP